MARDNSVDHGVVLYGTRANDDLVGTQFDDLFFASSGSDSFSGGGGSDTVSYEFSRSGVHVDLHRGYGSGGLAEGDTYWSIENAIGSNHNDTIFGNNGNNRLEGLDGDDLLYGLAGNDVILGGNGNDTIFSGAGADIVDGGWGTDTASYRGSGAGVNIDLAAGTAMGGDATLDVLTSIENLVGSSRHDDILAGDEGWNVLDGWGGDDTFFGTAGNDTIIGGTGSDTMDYSRLDAGILVEIEDDGLLVTKYEGNGSDRLSGVETVIGTDYYDLFVGDGGSFAFFGGDGSDMFGGADGADHFDGGTGFDIANYSSSDEGVIVDLKNGTGVGGHAEGDTYAGIEAAFGSAHSDVLVGGDGDNSLEGHDGSDVLNGGAGSDTLKGDVWGGWADTFVFTDTRDAEMDSIVDFEAGLDQLDFTDTAFTGWNDLFNGGDRYIEQDGDDAVIHYYDHTITLVGVQVDDLSQSDFLF